MNKLKGFTNRWSLKDDDSEGSVSQNVRRKEQLRRAQQNYRQRKEGYIKSLETEVVNLRTTRTDLQGETRRLSAEINWLRHIIDANHITLPPVPPEILALGSRQSSPASTTATVGVDRDHLNNRRLIVGAPASSTSGTSPSLLESGPERTPSPFRNPGDVVVAMNFILCLEGPCLDHVRSALKSPEPHTGHGHALTLTASVFRLYPDAGHSHEEDQQLSISRKTLDRLLELSAQLPTGDELTPIEVWACLCQNAAVAGAQPERIMAVAERLLDHIKCYGYGAVIPRPVVMEALRAF
ncbi:hypothetical protein BJX68DRAFT_229154 [Aspergillus pseudodeflectus]|uniref:BZIP domain-containing protein n=1 Tax=Aspergillus pseudodeflectus TaxID=176178 RepID=A0ABR4KZ75_9EURO